METVEIVRVRFHWPGKIHEFSNPNNLVLKRKDQVVVEGSDRSLIVGTVSVEPRIRIMRDDDRTLTPVLRLASDKDIQLDHASNEFKLEVKSFFRTRLQSRETSGVKLVDCEKSSSGRKLIVYYSSENKKFDYRLMSKEMAKKFGVKVDMRPVGIRDAARLAGGIGKCGLSTCCSTWLPDFQAVSIRMAKDQGLSLDPESINGQCGRLLCCLGYEHQNYVELVQGLPKMGKMVVTPIGDARVVKLDILKQLVTVRSEEGKMETFKGTEVRRKFGPQGQEIEGERPQYEKVEVPAETSRSEKENDWQEKQRAGIRAAVDSTKSESDRADEAKNSGRSDKRKRRPSKRAHQSSRQSSNQSNKAQGESRQASSQGSENSEGQKSGNKKRRRRRRSRGKGNPSQGTSNKGDSQ